MFYAQNNIEQYLQHSIMDVFIAIFMIVLQTKVTIHHLLSWNCAEMHGRPKLRPGPRSGSLQHSPDTLARIRGPNSKGKGKEEWGEAGEKGKGKGSGAPTFWEKVTPLPCTCGRGRPLFRCSEQQSISQTMLLYTTHIFTCLTKPLALSVPQITVAPDMSVHRVNDNVSKTHWTAEKRKL